MAIGRGVSSRELSELNRLAVNDRAQIIALFQRARRSRTLLRGARGFGDTPPTARVVGVSSNGIALATDTSTMGGRSEVVLSFEGDAGTYSFCAQIAQVRSQRLIVETPAVVYLSDRRERRRYDVEQDGEGPVASFSAPTGSPVRALVSDWSGEGLAIKVRDPRVVPADRPFQVIVERPGRAPEQRWATFRHSEIEDERKGWVRIGLHASEVKPSNPIDVVRRKRVLDGTFGQRMRRNVRTLGQVALSSRPVRRATRGRKPVREVESRVVDYWNEKGERIRGILDCCGRAEGGVGVVVPSAWGRTKETLLPLADTIVETFRLADEPVVVLRFDGIRRRGESQNEASTEKREYQNTMFTMSQGVRDIGTSARFLVDTFGVDRTVLVTFSASAVEGRRALVHDQESRRVFAGWVSVVGAPDIQSGIRSVSGGVDFLGGAEKGIKFGLQEVMGVLVDMDLLAEDALSHRLAFLEDAKRDFSQIDTPIVWIHGRHDAWLDLKRVREVMGVGDTGNRRLLEVGTGHQLRSSREALRVFQLVASEVGRLARGKAIEPRIPNLMRLEERRRAERARLKIQAEDLRGFWKDYVIGRDGRSGIELMNAMPDYAEFMRAQIAALRMRENERIADLGCGTGSFARYLGGWEGLPNGVRVDCVDFVPEALSRAHERLKSEGRGQLTLRYVAADLGDKHCEFPLRDGVYDAAIASLFLSYVEDPALALDRIRRLIRPGGRLVLSTMKRDADVSKLFVRGREHLRSSVAVDAGSDKQLQDIDEQLRSFLNDAAKILELEDEGRFRFWDASEFARVAIRSGFVEVRTERAFGSPPQAVVLSAIRQK